MLQPENTCPKTGLPVLDVPGLKHPKACPPSVHSLEDHGGKAPAMVPVDNTDATMATVAQRMLGSTEPGGVDSISLQHWLLRFGVASLLLRKIVGEFGDWMANGCPPPTLGSLQGTDVGAPHWPQKFP